jgi:hypothetical protein
MAHFAVAWALLALAKSENSDSAKLVNRTRTAHFISGMHNYPGSVPARPTLGHLGGGVVLIGSSARD